MNRILRKWSLLTLVCVLSASGASSVFAQSVYPDEIGDASAPGGDITQVVMWVDAVNLNIRLDGIEGYNSDPPPMFMMLEVYPGPNDVTFYMFPGIDVFTNPGSTMFHGDSYLLATIPLSTLILGDEFDFLLVLRYYGSDGTSIDYVGICHFPATPPGPQTAEEHITAALDLIDQLISEGVLASNKAKPLLSKLENALRKLEANNVQGAVGSLNAAVNQIHALINSGKLTAEESAPLLEMLTATITLLLG